MIKKILLLFIVLVSISCQIEYDGASKYIVKTKIIDSNGNPIADVPVDVNISVGNLSDKISFTTSDAKGNGLLMFPPPKSSETEFSISYNVSDYDETNNIPSYFSKSIYSIKKSDFVDYIFDAGTIMLFKNEEITKFTISKEKVTQNTALANISTTLILVEHSENYNTPEETDYSYPVYVIKNQNFTLNYTVIDYSFSPPISTLYTDQLTVGNEPLNYTIFY